MSLKVELETWGAALDAYNEENFDLAIQRFEEIADTSKILTNIGLIHATIGEHDKAVDYFNAATLRDPHLAIAYMQTGVSNFILKRYDLAYEDFRVTLAHLRDNSFINYEQLGLDWRLYAAEVMFNKGLCRIYQGRVAEGLEEMAQAVDQKVTDDHNVIDEAILDEGKGYTVFSIPVGKLYRPPEGKLKNTKTKNYLGESKLVAASDVRDAYTTFVGVTRLKQGMTPSGAPLYDQTRGPDITGPMDNPVDAQLGRSKTVNARAERTDSPSRPPPPANNLLRSMSTNPPRPRSGSEPPVAPPPAAVPISGPPVRGLSVRRPTLAGGETERSGRSSPARPQVERQPTNRQGQGREQGRREPTRAATMDNTGREGRGREPSRGVTQFYDDYLDAYGVDTAQTLRMQDLNLGGGRGGAGGGTGQDRVAAWATKTTLGAPPNIPPSRAPSQRGGNASYGGQGSLRRKMSRGTIYGDESADYEDAGLALKIRVKLHYKDDVRGMALTPDSTFEDFLDKVMLKFGKRFGELVMKFTDEDGGKVTLRDEMDYDLAIETAKEGSRGRGEGKLEVWLSDL